MTNICHKEVNSDSDTILGALDRRARSGPGGAALRCHDRAGVSEVTWAELAARARRIAAGWRALGLREGEPVAILMANSPDLLAVQLGIIAAGGLPAVLDPAQMVRTIGKSVSFFTLRFFLIGEADALTSVESAGLGSLEFLVHRDPLPRAAICPALTLAALEGMGQGTPLPGTDPDKTCLAAFTMGCSGTPIPVGLSQAALLAAGRGLAETLGLRPGDSYLSLSHLSSSWTMQEFLACMQSGAEMSLMGWRPDIYALEKTAKRISPAIVRLSHAAFIEIFTPYLREGLVANRAPLALRLKAAVVRIWTRRGVESGGRGGAALIRRALFPGLTLGRRVPRILLSGGTLSQKEQDVMKSLGQPILHSYGLTEACGFVTIGREGERSQGRPIAGMRLNTDPTGEIQVSGPAVMNGYLCLPNSRSGPSCEVRGKELLTRDYGLLDAEGGLVYERSARYQYTLADGSVIYCDQVGKLLMEDPLVMRAAVVGGEKHGFSLKSMVAIIAPDPDALRRTSGSMSGDWFTKESREYLIARLRRRLEILPPEQRPAEFAFSSPYSSAVWMGKLCPDRRLRYAMIQPRDDFSLLYLQLRDSPKPQAAPGVSPRNLGEPIFLSVESEFDRPLMRHELANREFGFKPDKVLGGGIASLLGSLEHAGWDPDYLPYRFQWHRTIEPQIFRLVEFLSNRPGRIITAGCASIALPFLLSALKEVCRRDPSRKVVLGGCGPSVAASSIIANFPFVDAVILGEAERSLPRVLGALSAGEDLSRIPGIVARSADGKIVSGVPERIRDLNALPRPSYGRIDLRLYHHVSVPTMRGCPNNCKFCGNRAMFGPGVSLRSIDLVMEELRMLHYELGQNDFFISDDTFTLLKPRVLEFCSRMRKEFGQKVNWFCYASVESLDAERMRAMSGAGCRRIFIGVESGSDRLLKKYKGGGYTAAQAVEKIAEASKYFSSVQVGLIVGFPDETLKDFIHTIRLARMLMKNGYGDVVMQWLKAIPLTPLFENNRASLIIPSTVQLYKGSDKHSAWAKDFARIDPSLAPWSAQIPTPHQKVKQQMLLHFMQNYWNL